MSPAIERDGTVPGGPLLGSRYRLVRLLAEGERAVLHEAVDEQLGVPVIIARPSRDSGGDDAARFRAACALARHVSHPNVCRVFDLGADSGTPFAALEYVPGETIGEWIRRAGPPDAARAAWVLEQVAAGLEAARARGVAFDAIGLDDLLLVGDPAPRVIITAVAAAAPASAGSRETNEARLAALAAELGATPRRAEAAVPRRSRARWIAVVAGVAVIAAGLAVVAFVRGGDGGTPDGGAAHRIAVVGFEAPGGAPDQTWIGPALKELTTAEIRAVSRFQVADGEGRPAALGVDRVVTGSYRVTGDQLEIGLRVSEVASGRVIAELSERGKVDRLLEIVPRAGERLRAALGAPGLARTDRAALDAGRPASPEAAKHYAEGRNLEKAFDMPGARVEYERAIDTDPTFAMAHLGLALTLVNTGQREMARAAARRAFELSAKLSRHDRLLVEQFHRRLEGDVERSIALERELVALDPTTQGPVLVEILVDARRYPEAAAELEQLRAMKLPPVLLPMLDHVEARMAGLMGDADRSIELARKAADAELAAGRPYHAAEARRTQAEGHLLKGEPDRAVPLLEEARALFAAEGNRFQAAATALSIGNAQAMAGHLAAASESYQHSLATMRETGSVGGAAHVLESLAEVQAPLGRFDEARHSYQEAIELARREKRDGYVLYLQVHLAQVLASQGRARDAAALLEPIPEHARPIDANLLAEALTHRAGLRLLMGNLAGARADLGEARAIRMPHGELSYPDANLGWASLLRAENQPAEAEEILRAELADEAKRPNPVKRMLLDLMLADLLVDARRAGEARELMDAASPAVEAHEDVLLRLSSRMTAARVRALGGSAADIAAARQLLDEVRAEAERIGAVEIGLEAEVQRARIDLTSAGGDRRLGGRRLGDLKRRVRAAGMIGLFAPDLAGARRR